MTIRSTKLKRPTVNRYVFFSLDFHAVGVENGQSVRIFENGRIREYQIETDPVTNWRHLVPTDDTLSREIIEGDLNGC